MYIAWKGSEGPKTGQLELFSVANEKAKLLESDTKARTSLIFFLETYFGNTFVSTPFLLDLNLHINY